MEQTPLIKAGAFSSGSLLLSPHQYTPFKFQSRIFHFLSLVYLLMGDFRSSSYRDVGRQMQSYHGGKSWSSAAAAPSSMQELRCFSASYANPNQLPSHMGKEIKIKKSKSVYGLSSSSLKNWSFNDPELQRKKRVAGYKVYSVEAKMKGSLRKSFRWIKDTCTQVVYGWK